MSSVNSSFLWFMSDSSTALLQASVVLTYSFQNTQRDIIESDFSYFFILLVVLYVFHPSCRQRDRMWEKSVSLNCCLLPSCSTPNRWTPGLGLMWPAPPSSFSSSASSRLSSCHRESTLGNNTQIGPWKFEIYFTTLKSLLWLQFKQL